MSATIVTGFYQLEKSKHSVRNYIQWIGNFCKIPRPMVIFTDSKTAPLLERLREGHPLTRVIVKEFDSYEMTSPEMVAFWERQWHLDPEAKIHSPNLYAVWAIKQECVKLAIEANPFKHDWFIWCDIGIQRHSEKQAYYQTFGDEVTTLCTSGSIHFLEVEVIPDALVAKRGTVPMPYPPPSVTLGGGCIVGDRATWATFSLEYTAMLEKFEKRGWFAGKDQIVYFAMLMEQSLPFRLFHAERFAGRRGDPWMVFPVILGGNTRANIDVRFESSTVRSTPKLDILTKYSMCYLHLMGGLGNQMFEIAAGYAHSRRTGKKLQLPTNTSCKRPTYWNSFLQNCSPFISKLPIESGINIWKEPHFHYQAIPAVATGLFGYFQSSRYFADCSGEIRTLFEPQQAIKATVAERYAGLLTEEGRKTSCVVHVRRTDYLVGANMSIHAVCDKDWYARALVEMDHHQRAGQAIRYLVFSDDLAWCRASEQADLWTGRDVVFVDEPTDYLALHLMSQFGAFVIPNSSFSWWAAWLSSAADKTVIAPNRWFGPKGPQDWDDIYEPDWIRLP